jgi:hypothetical protein
MRSRSFQSLAAIGALFAPLAGIPNQIHSDVVRAELIRAAVNKERGLKSQRDLSSKRGKKRKR